MVSPVVVALDTNVLVAADFNSTSSSARLVEAVRMMGRVRLVEASDTVL